MHDNLELYSLDALEESEREEFETHLTVCDQCSDELASYYEVLAALSVSETTRPPARLKMRVLAIPGRTEAPGEIRPHSNVTTVKRWTVIAIGSIAASFLLGATLSPLLKEETNVGAQPVVQPVVTPVSLLDEVQGADDSSTVMRKVKTSSLRIDYSRSMGVAIFSAKSLSPLLEGEVYQLWTQNHEGSMIPAGDFTGSSALVLVEGSLEDAVAVGITKEASAGHKVPTSTPIAILPL